MNKIRQASAKIVGFSVLLMSFAAHSQQGPSPNSCGGQVQTLKFCISTSMAGEIPCNWTAGVASGVLIDTLTDSDTIAAFAGILGGYASEFVCDELIEWGNDQCVVNHPLTACLEIITPPPPPGSEDEGEGGQETSEDNGDVGTLGELIDELIEIGIEFYNDEFNEGYVTVEEIPDEDEVEEE